MSSRPDLSDEEVGQICAGYTQHLAKVRFLQRLGLRVDRRPAGRSLREPSGSVCLDGLRARRQLALNLAGRAYGIAGAENPSMATQHLPFTTSLPDAFNTLIGLIMVRWGYLELRLQQLVFMTLRVSEPQGRLAVKNLRAMEMVELAVDLMLLEGVRLEVEGLSQLKEIESRRNLLAHGVWHHDAAGGTYILRDLTGAWRAEEKGGAKVKRKILPAGVPITVHNLQDLASAVEGAVRNAEEVGRVIQEQRASRAAASGQP